MQNEKLATGSGRQRKSVRLSAWALAALGILVGCSKEVPMGEPLVEGELAVAPIEWNTSPIGAGRIVAIAENDDDVALFSDNGVSLWTGGDSLGRDSAVRSWRSAANVPALGFAGRWLLGVSDDGKLYRLRFGGNQPLTVEEVTGRYQLTGKPVSEVAALGGSSVGFVLDGRLAISDGTTLKHYDLNLHSVVGSQGRAVGIFGDQVVVLDVGSESLERLELPSVKWVTSAPDGQIWAATDTGLCQKRGDHFEQVYAAPEGQSVRGLSSSPSGVWVLLSGGIALLRDGQILQAALPPQIVPVEDSPSALRLIGSSSGDAWLVGESLLVRVGEESGGGQDLVLWRKNMLPIFSRQCQGCHLPNGSAHLDLSTHHSWDRYRRVLAQRVVDGMPTPMPPIGTGKLTADELAAVAAWTARP